MTNILVKQIFDFVVITLFCQKINLNFIIFSKHRFNYFYERKKNFFWFVFGLFHFFNFFYSVFSNNFVTFICVYINKTKKNLSKGAELWEG